MNPEGFGQHLIATWMSQIILCVVLMVIKVMKITLNPTISNQKTNMGSDPKGLQWQLGKTYK